MVLQGRRPGGWSLVFRAGSVLTKTVHYGCEDVGGAMRGLRVLRFILQWIHVGSAVRQRPSHHQSCDLARWWMGDAHSILVAAIGDPQDVAWKVVVALVALALAFNARRHGAM